MAIVGILTLNGVFIHHSVLPLIRQKIGQSLLDGLSGRQRSILLAAGVVSGTSWYVPLLLGSVPQLNFVVPAWVILAAYGVLLGTGIVLVQTVARAILPATDAAPGEERPNPVAQRSIRLTAQPPWNNTALALQGVSMQVFAASNGQTARAGCADNLFRWDQPTK